MADGPDVRRRADTARRNNPMNRLVPYLDLFARLDDAELSRLADVDTDTVATLRRQVVEVGAGLAHYLDLLPRLSDDELVRLTGISAKTIRFWRLCQPRGSAARQPSAEISSITPMPRPMATPTPAPQPIAAAPQPMAAPRRRTTGVGIGAPVTPSPSGQPVADWSIEAAATNCATTVTPPPRSVPAANWDTTSPTAGTATMITPEGQAPAGWGRGQPSDMPTQPGATPLPRRPSAAIDPSESQQAAARASDIGGEPFPGFEGYRPMREDELGFDDLRR